MSAHWSEQREGGFPLGIRLFVALALRCGRRAARAALYPITLYFFLRRPYERRASRAFLARAFGRRARAGEVMRHIHAFAATLLDRIFLLAGRFRGFDVSVHGLDALTSRMQPGRGVLLLGAHVGSFEVLRALADGHGDVDVRAVLDTQKTPALTAALHALNPAIASKVIDASRSGPEIALALHEAVHEGALATLLGDRARPHEASALVEFMGAPARFPVAPYLLGAALKVPVVFCLGLYRGGNRYEIHFEAFADEIVLSRRERQGELRALAQRYAARLE
ncbi:MAG TPA: acyltransferase, partial [Dokdonella sp.]